MISAAPAQCASFYVVVELTVNNLSLPCELSTQKSTTRARAPARPHVHTSHVNTHEVAHFKQTVLLSLLSSLRVCIIRVVNERSSRKNKIVILRAFISEIVYFHLSQ